MNKPDYARLIEFALNSGDGEIRAVAERCIEQAGSAMHFEQLNGEPPRAVIGFAEEADNAGGERIDNIGIYMMLANKTLSGRVRESWKETMLNAATGIASEGGEINELIKKHFFHFHPMNYDTIAHLRKEVGDAFWYLALICHAMRWEPAVVLAVNIAKLKARYPEGFDPERSLHRAPGDV